MNCNIHQDSPVLLSEICSSNSEARRLIEKLIASYNFFFFERQDNIIIIKKSANEENANIDIKEKLEIVSAFIQGSMQRKIEDKQINISHCSQFVVKNNGTANFKIEQQNENQEEEEIGKIDEFANTVTFLQGCQQNADKNINPLQENNRTEESNSVQQEEISGEEEEVEDEEAEEKKGYEKEKKEKKNLLIDETLKENFELCAELHPFSEKNFKTRKEYDEFFKAWEFFVQEKEK